MDHIGEALIGLVGAHGDAFQPFELAEEVLDQVPPFVHLLVEGERLCGARMLEIPTFAPRVSSSAIAGATERRKVGVEMGSAASLDHRPKRRSAPTSTIARAQEPASLHCWADRPTLFARVHRTGKLEDSRIWMGESATSGCWACRGLAARVLLCFLHEPSHPCPGPAGESRATQAFSPDWLNPLSEAERQSPEMQKFGRRILDSGAEHFTWLVWRYQSKVIDTPLLPRQGSVFFLDCGRGPFAVTADHVFD